MSCESAPSLLSAFVDRELDVAKSVEIEAHLRSCSRCAAAVRELEALRSSFRGANLAFAPPPGLERRIRKSLASEARPKVRWSLSWGRWLAVPAAATLAAMLTWNVAANRSGTSAEEMLTADLVAGHVRSLMADHLVDVATSDQHTVKPWFNGKVEFAPPVVDFTAAGFPLVGGRVDYIGGRPVAVLVYKRRQHLVNVFIWPAASAAAAESPPARLADGYHLLPWTQSGLSFWAVSDVGAADLESLAHLIRDAG